MNEKQMNLEAAEQTEKKEEAQPKRARLTVEIPTDITAGRAPVACYCSRSYCCS